MDYCKIPLTAPRLGPTPPPSVTLGQLEYSFHNVSHISPSLTTFQTAFSHTLHTTPRPCPVCLRALAHARYVCKILPPSSALGGESLWFLSSKPVGPFGLGHLTQTSVMSSNVTPTHRPAPSQPTTPYPFLPPPAQASYTLLHPASLPGHSLVCLRSVVLCLWAFFKVVSQGHEVSVIAPCRRTPLISWGWGGERGG